MNTKPKYFVSMLLAAVILLVNFGGMPGIVHAEEGDGGLIITATPVIQCGDVEYTISWENGATPYFFVLNYGDGDTSGILELDSNSITLNHTYIDQGEYEWTVQVEETVMGGLAGTTSGVITLDGPAVTLSSVPFPPLVVLGVDDGLIEFSAAASGGTLPYEFYWDADGDGVDDGVSGESASATFTEVGKYQAQVMVVDGCGFSATDTLPVVVADPEDICHPMAQTIADGVNTIFPDQSGDLYTCDDIYGIFDNEGEENNIGFGRMWKAYNLALTMEELFWEDILAWHLDESGWGTLLQLDRFADLLEEHSLPDLMALVMSEEYSLGDVRTAVRSVTRYEAGFEDALSRIADGANPGELGQLYKLAADLEVDPSTIDEYLADGLTLSELKHTANFADRMEVDWTEIADARTSADSWGDISQAYKLATDGISAAEILILGIQDYRKDLREEDKEDRQEKQAEQKEERNEQTTEKLAEQFSAEPGDVMDLFNGECEGNWGCVRKALRDQEMTQSTQSEGLSEKDLQTALQIGSKYGFTEEEVIEYHNEFCGGDWSCTRAHYRDLYMSTKETGKPSETGKPEK